MHDVAKDKLTMPDGARPTGLGAIDPEAVAGRIGALIAEHRPGAARPLLAALAKLAPDHEQLPLLRVGYWCQMQDISQALAVLEEAISRQPGNATLWIRQAEIFFAERRYDDAAQSAAQTVLLAPALDPAKSRLGLALMQLGKFDQALPCLAESFSVRPANAEVALALAALSPAAATGILQQAIASNPRAVVLQNVLARRYLSCGNVGQGMQAARQAIASGVADVQTHCLLAFAQMQEANWDDAAHSVARAQSMVPENLWAAQLVQALSGRALGQVDPAAFPEDAGIAEQALIAGGTIAPGAFRALMETLEASGPVLDVFCGSGLNAIAGQGLGVGPWFGIDPRQAMIARCAAYGIYAALQQSDPLRGLALQMPAAPSVYPIILLNEALAYLEFPQAFLGTIYAALSTDGIAIAAIPTGRPGLSGHGLFTHRVAAIAQYAAGAGLSFETPRTGILRYLEGLPIHGVIAVFRRL